MYIISAGSKYQQLLAILMYFLLRHIFPMGLLFGTLYTVSNLYNYMLIKYCIVLSYIMLKLCCYFYYSNNIPTEELYVMYGIGSEKKKKKKKKN